MSEIWVESSTTELLQFAALVFGIGFVPIFILSKMLEFFVGLKSPPTKRAALTVGIAFTISVIAFALLAPLHYALLAFIAPIPGAVGWFLYLRSHLRRAWYDNAEDVPDDVELATDDWQQGVGYLLAAVVVAIGMVALKIVTSGFFSSI